MNSIYIVRYKLQYTEQIKIFKKIFLSMIIYNTDQGTHLTYLSIKVMLALH